MNIGTPAQEVFVQLDTGSFELWVNPTCTGLSLSDATFCKATGSFVTSESSTAVNMKTTKKLAYGIGSANITYFKDSIALPGATSPMTDVQFGVSTSSADEFSGILGIGYGYGLTTTYPNFIDELALQNQTSVKAFSVGLGSKAEQEGAIVFGGVDTSKFAGKLATLPIVPAASSPDGVPRYWISMNNVSLTPPNGVTKTYANTSMDVFLDTGATLSLLPTALVTSIATDFGSPTVNSEGYYQVDCGFNDMNGTVNFAFNGVTIKVPYNEFIRETGSGSAKTCVLGITASSTFTLLGDTFMRAAYGMPKKKKKKTPFPALHHVLLLVYNPLIHNLSWISQPCLISTTMSSTCSSTTTAAQPRPPSRTPPSSAASKASATPRATPWAR